MPARRPASRLSGTNSNCNNGLDAGAMDPARGALAKRVRFRARRACCFAVQDGRADRAVGRRSGALSLRADRTAQVRAGTPRPLALLGARLRGGYLPPV